MAYDIPMFLNELEEVGVFDYMLPFLLIFAVVFGILTATNILGKNKGVSLVVSLTIGLLALRFGFVQIFFNELFPRMGVALAALLAVVILAAVFIPTEHMNVWSIIFAVSGAVFGLIAVLNTFMEIDWFGNYWFEEYFGLLVGGILMIMVIVAIFISQPGKEKAKELHFKKLRED